MQASSEEEKKALKRAKAAARQRAYRQRLKDAGIEEKRLRTPEQYKKNAEACKRYREKNREELRLKERVRQAAIRRAKGMAVREESVAITRAKEEVRAKQKAVERKKREAEKRARAQCLAAEKAARAAITQAKKEEKLALEALRAQGKSRVVRKLEDPTPPRTVMSLWEGKRMPDWLKAQVAASPAADEVIEKQSLRRPDGRRNTGPVVVDGVPIVGRTADLFPIYAGITRPSRTLAIPEWGGKVRCSLRVTPEDIWGEKVIFLPTYQLFIPPPGFAYSLRSCRMQINGMKGVALWLTPKAI